MKKPHFNFLFVDDSKNDNFLTLSTIEIDELPIRPTFYTDPVEALIYLEHLVPESFPDAIIVDINMPLINGFEFVEKYTQSLMQKRSDTLLYMTSSSCRPSDISRVQQQEHVVSFLQKPFSCYIFDQIVPFLNRVKIAC